MEMEAEGKKAGTQEAEAQKAGMQRKKMQETVAQKAESQRREERQKAAVQKSADSQKNKGQSAREKKEVTRKDETGQILPKGGAAPQDSGKETKAAPGTASKAAPKASAKNESEQTAENGALGGAVTESTIPEGAVRGKGKRTTGKQKPKTEPGVKTGASLRSGVVLMDKDSIMM